MGTSLRDARNATLKSIKFIELGRLWHYGHVGDRLVQVGNPSAVSKSTTTVTPTTVAIMSTTIEVPDAPLISRRPTEGEAMADESTAAATHRPDDRRIVVNASTSEPEITPRAASIDEIAKPVRSRRPHVWHGTWRREAFVRAAVRCRKIEKAGWAIVFGAAPASSVRDALPLIEHRRKQAGRLLKELDYNGEQLRDWLGKQGVSPGNMKPAKLPYYVMLVGSPEQIPFEFQYLLGVEYAVGHLSFDDATDYARYASSTIAYESGATFPRPQISYGTRHRADDATKLSATFLIDPLTNSVPQREDQGQPINKLVIYSQRSFLGRMRPGPICLDTAGRQTARLAVHRLPRHGVRSRRRAAGDRPGRAVVPGLAEIQRDEARAFPVGRGRP